MKFIYIYLILSIQLVCFSSAFAAEGLKSHLDIIEHGGLEIILKKKYFRVLTTRNPYDYYMHKGRAMGIQYEMVKEFAKYLNKKYVKKGELRIAFEIIPVDFDQLIPMLIEGKGDFIAVGLTKTPERKKLIDFTIPYQKVDDVIVTRKTLAKEPWQGKTFHVQEDSSYQKTLTDSKYQVNVEEIDANFNAADLMEFVSLKKYDYALVNSFWAKKINRRFGNLVVLKDRPFRKKVGIGWAVRKDNKKLLKELNAFLPLVKKGSLLGNLLNYKYFNNVGKLQSEDFNIDSSTISKYDKIFKKYAKKFGFDWRLLASICYQESRFRQDIVNKWGAIGLFQIKQTTANEPYVGIRNIRGKKNYDNNVHAGVKYLAWIKKTYLDSKKEMSEEARLRMAMAGYNAGPGRLLQAIKKAKKMGLDPNRWFRNVELAMLKLGYPEPVIYVSEINKHYVGYVLLGIK